MKELCLRLGQCSQSPRVTGVGGGNGVSALGYNVSQNRIRVLDLLVHRTMSLL